MEITPPELHISDVGSKCIIKVESENENVNPLIKKEEMPPTFENMTNDTENSKLSINELDTNIYIIDMKCENVEDPENLLNCTYVDCKPNANDVKSPLNEEDHKDALYQDLQTDESSKFEGDNISNDALYQELQTDECSKFEEDNTSNDNLKELLSISFTENQSFEQHIDKKHISCQICSKQFSKPSTLNVHMRVHNREKPFSCGICSRQFSQSSNLNTHMHLHTGEKLFKCEICFKQFLRRSGLYIHMRQHTCENPFTCEICYKKFSQSSNLNTHM